MIQHIFKIIWNERKVNGWILFEYILVFCILWFCVDYLYFMGKSYLEPLGFDTTHVYKININLKDKELLEGTEFDSRESLQTIIERIERHPAIESVGFSNNCMPYRTGWSKSNYKINNDSVSSNFIIRKVSKGFFDVFRVKVTGKELDQWGDGDDRILVTPGRNNLVGKHPDPLHPVESVKMIGSMNSDDKMEVKGYTTSLRANFFQPYENGVMIPKSKKDIHRGDDITVRVKPEADKNFEEKFTADMRTQLSEGAFYLTDVVSLKKMEKQAIESRGVRDTLNSVYAITGFLIINIFLGVIGTFWYRTQSRQGEIGVRIALGATKGKVKGMLYGETLLLLFLASLISINICVNLTNTDILEILGLPLADRIQKEGTWRQYVIDYLVTFFFLGIISLIAVWYPARQASEVQPAESLRDE